MRRFAEVLGVAVLAVLATATAARAEPEPPVAELVLRQRLALVLNPMGAEHYTELAGRAPLGDPESLLLSLAHVEAGALTAVSPVYGVGGGYLQISPVSFLVLRGQLTGQGVWSIPMDGAGHYGLDGYDADVSMQALPAGEGGSATGFTASVAGTLQGMLPIGSVRLLLLDELSFEHAELGNDPFYYDQRNDLVRAQSDWLVRNGAFLGLELDVAENVIGRFGAYDDLRHVPAADYVANQVGIVGMFSIARPGSTVAEIEPFVRAGFYTHHHLREDTFTVLGGVQVRYELAALR